MSSSSIPASLIYGGTPVTRDGVETLTNKTLTSPTLVTPALGTPASGVLTNCTGLPPEGITQDGATTGQGMFWDGAAWAPRDGIVAGTAAASTSGTNVQFTGLPSWVKWIAIVLDSFSSDGTGDVSIRIGDSGGFENTGYVSNASDFGGAVADTTAFILTRTKVAADECSGVIFLCKVSGNTWVSSGNIINGVYVSPSAGVKTLTATLDRFQVRAAGDTLDNGQVNVFYG